MNIIVCNTQVSINKDGLYCLNDLHKASGGESKNRPGYWLDTATAKKMIQLLEVRDGKPALKTSKGGSNPGTYACKELVYDYAMWISAEFKLLVIKIFDEWLHEEYQRKAIRENARDGYKDLTKAIKESRGDSAKWYHYSNEADMINKIVLGCTAKDFRIKHDLGDNEHLRDKLSAFEILAIEQLQRMDEQLINMGFDLDSRREHLLERFSYLKRTMNISLDNPKPLTYDPKTT